MAVELKSEGDETYEKLDLYAGLPIPELWVIDADTCRPELHVLAGSNFTPRKADHNGWLPSVATGIQFRAVANGLQIQLVADPDTLATVGDKMQANDPYPSAIQNRCFSPRMNNSSPTGAGVASTVSPTEFVATIFSSFASSITTVVPLRPVK